MIELFVEYPEDKIKAAKLGIERVKDLKNDNMNIYEFAINDIKFNHKFSDIKSIDIKINTSCPFATVRINAIGGNVLLGYIPFDDKFDFDKILNGTAKIYPADREGMIGIFTNLFCEIDSKSDDEDRPYKPIELKKILRLYNEFLDKYDDYLAFNDFAVLCCEYTIEHKHVYINLFDDYCRRNDNNMLNVLHDFSEEMIRIWDELPKRYKPVKYKTIDDLNNLIKDFANALREIYLDKIEIYKGYTKGIDNYLTNPQGE